MNKQRKWLRELPWGLLVIAGALGLGFFIHKRQLELVPSSLPPLPGETLTGDAAARLHPKVVAPPFDASAFARLPAECGCELASGRVQLLMFVKGKQQSISDHGMATYVVHEIAIAKTVDGGERSAPFPALDDAAPARRTQGFKARFDLACTGDRMIVVDAIHATLWDLAKDRPRKLWSTPLPARRGAVVDGASLAIECHPAQREGDHVIVDPKGTPFRLRLADGKIEP